MMKKFVFILFFLLITFNRTWSKVSISVVESLDDRLIVKVADINLSFEEIEIDGVTYQKIHTDDVMRLTAEHGAPQLPCIAVSFIVPDESQPVVRILDRGTPVSYKKKINPAPHIKFNHSDQYNSLVKEYVENRDIYAQDRFYPEYEFNQVRIEKMRSQSIASLFLYPARYNPVTNDLIVHPDMTIEIVYANDSKSLAKGNVPFRDKYFDSMIKKIVLNPEKASTFSQKHDIVEKEQFHWRSQNEFWYRMKVVRDDLYRLSYDYLLNNNIFVESMDPSQFSIFNKGEEIPIHVQGGADGRFDPGDYIEFYGTMNYGDTTYYHAVTDTNVYWLTFGENIGLRYDAKPGLIDEFEKIETYSEFQHIEKDLKYYSGDVALQIVDTDIVPGEGWYWDMFYENDSRNYDIELSDVDFQSSEPCTLEVYLRGTTDDPVADDHRITFMFNNEFLDEIVFDGRKKVRHKMTFSQSKLKQHNVLSIKSNATEAALNAFYLDWMNIYYRARFNSQKPLIQYDCEVDGEYQVSLWNVTNEEPAIYNASQNYKIEDMVVEEKQRFIIEAGSGGFNDGNYARTISNTTSILDGGKRGINAVVFDMHTGQFLQNRHFDTHASADQSDSLVQYITSLDTFHTIILTIRDEATNSLKQNARNAIESIGSIYINQLQFRDSWAIIGRKGADRGSVPEMRSPAGSGPAVVSDSIYTEMEGNYHVRFADNFEKGDTYIISTTDSFGTPVDIQEVHDSDIRETNNRVDYIMIYHHSFLEVARQFSDFWIGRGLATKLIDIDDIYTEFSYGIKTPGAIRHFLIYAYQYWQKPAPSYVLLIGDASWDPKKNSVTSTKKDYIPSYGHPVTDHWYVCLDGEDDMLADMFIGRLPIETSEQGLAYLEKVKAYETYPSAAWKKNILFINGGFDDEEQAVFGAQTDRIVNEYISRQPASMIPTIVSKELDGLYEGEKREDIKEGINKGQLWVNFIGHGGSGTWELMFHDEQVFELTNEGKLPFVSSLTCHTGRFANPEVTNFGENFVLTESAGAIGFMGSSGWGFVSEDEQFARRLFKAVFVDTVHEFARAMTLAKYLLWTESSYSVPTKSVVYQYSILGDPALDLTLPDKPDLVVDQSSLGWNIDAPVESDSTLTFDVSLYNYGLHAPDSIRLLVLDDFLEKGQNEILNDLVPPFGYNYNMSIDWPLKDMAGKHEITLNADPADEMLEGDENNNSRVFPINIGSSRLSISKPVNNAMISNRTPLLQIYHPQGDSQDATYVFELDTSATFDSPGVLHSGSIPQGKVVTNWRAPELMKPGSYHWRCRTESDNGNWIYSDFIIKNKMGWEQNHYHFQKYNIHENTILNNSVLHLDKRRTAFHVESSGLDDKNMAAIFINSMAVTEIKRGLNVAFCDIFGNLIQSGNYDTYANEDHVFELIKAIDNLETGFYAIIGIKDTGEKLLTEAAYQALESIGSQYCRDVGFRDGWAIIGRKGASIGSVPEEHVKRFEGTAVLDDTLVTYHSAGSMISSEIGPANGWDELRWEIADTSDKAGISIDVFGQNNSAGWDTLMIGLEDSGAIPLQSIDHTLYRKLKLRANLYTEKPFYSPALKEWSVTHEQVSDPAITRQVVEFAMDTVTIGENVNISAQIHNAGDASIDSLHLQFAYSSSTIPKTMFAERHLHNIPADSFFTISQEWMSAGRVGLNRIYIEIDPEDRIAELNEENNLFVGRIIVLEDTTAPNIDLTFDGRQVVDGSYVSRQPVIDIRIKDDVPIMLDQDTVAVRVMLDDERIEYYNNSDELKILPVPHDMEDEIKGWLRYTPLLADGEHTLHVFVADGSDNQNAYRVQFVVESELRLMDVLNYPNPFTYDTNFTYFLTQPADNVTIKIYTVAGRLILTMHNCSGDAGFNKVYWRGLDQDYDSLANGVYLYKVIARAGDEQVEVVEKLVIIR